MGVVDYLVEVIAFAVVLWVLYKYVWSGGLNLSGAMAARQQTIAAEIEESRETRERLVAAEGRYRDSIIEARAESARIRAEAATEGDQIVAELRVKAEEEYGRMTALNDTRLAAERQSVVAALRQEVGQRTLHAAEEIVTSALRDPGQQQRVVDRFIADLDGRSARVPGGSAGAEGTTGGADPAPQPTGRAR